VNATLVGVEEAVQHAQRRGLASAVGPKQPHDLSRFADEIDPVDHAASAEVLDQMTSVQEQ
jgi:hypothetical protein